MVLWLRCPSVELSLSILFERCRMRASGYRHCFRHSTFPCSPVYDSKSPKRLALLLSVVKVAGTIFVIGTPE